MKIIQLLEESSGITKEVILKIKKDCAPYLKAIGDYDSYVMYRGIGTKLPEGMTKVCDYINRGNVRKDREPLSTPKKAHKLVDDWMNRKYDVRYRSQALFCVGDNHIANKYGRAYAILPIGDFSVCWSQEFEDLYSDNAEIFDTFSDYTEEDAENRVLDVLDAAKFTEGKIKQAIKSRRHEIMVNCDSYYAIQGNQYFNLFVPAMDAFK